MSVNGCIFCDCFGFVDLQVIDFVNTRLPTSFLSELLSPNSILPGLCLSTDHKVNYALVNKVN